MDKKSNTQYDVFDKDIWSALDKDTQTLLEPIRTKLNGYQKKIDRLEVELQEVSDQRYFYKEAIYRLPNPIFMKDGNTKFMLVNQKYKDVFAIKEESLIGKKVQDLEYLSAEDRCTFQAEDEKMLRESSIVHYEAPFVFVDKNVHESFYWSGGFVVPETGERGLIGEIVDISSEKLLMRKLESSMEQLSVLNAEIQKLAHTDYLTGISNRYVLKDYIPALLERCIKNNEPFSIAIADIDHFKSVNDCYGHVVGDTVLKATADILKKNCRPEDLIMRYGGEEFLIIMPATTTETAINLSEQIRLSVQSNSVLPDRSTITISLGVSEYISGENLESQLSRADRALYISKNSGRNKVTSL